MSKSKQFLQQNLFEEGLKYFGIKNKNISIELSNIWHDDKNSWQTKRWIQAEIFGDHKGKILDMACGSGVFVFSGLHKGYDVYGIEPEEWKQQYINMKIEELSYPKEWKQRFIKAVGEDLPFENETFDYIESAQTLEHTNDYKKCLDELIRVLKVGGKIRIFAPDYEGFYEPHYRIPFLPKMNRTLAKIYLKILGKPIIGLNTITYITAKDIINYLSKKFVNIEIIDLYKVHRKRKIDYINSKFKIGKYLSNLIVGLIWYNFYRTKGIKPIDLVIKKVENGI